MLEKKIGISKCIYYCNLDVLHIAGYALPKAERCEIWNGENIVCQAQMGLRRQDLLKQKPEYDEEYAGWDIAICMDGNISAEIHVKVYYSDNICMEMVKEISCQTYEKEYEETEAWYRKMQSTLEISGVSGEKTQKIEIWNEYKCLGTVSEGERVERKFGVTSIPFRRWNVEIGDIQEMPARVCLYYYDGINNVVKREFKPKLWTVPLNKRIGISKCIYYKGASRLQIQGWSLSRVRDCGIYIGNSFYGNAQLDLKRDDILEKHAKYDWDAPGWNAIVVYDGNCDVPIELRFIFYDGKSLQVTTTINEIIRIDKIECQESFYLQNSHDLIISGKSLSIVDNNIQIWDDQKYIGEIEHQDYQGTDELGRNLWKKCLHNVSLGTNVICLREQDDLKKENFYGKVTVCDSSKKIQDNGLYRFTVNKAEYIPVADQIRLTGWCLPLPEKIEVVVEGRLEECEIRQLRDDVYQKMKWYNETRSGWSCLIHNITGLVEEVILKIYYGEEDWIEQTVSIGTLNKRLISFDMFDTLVERPVLDPKNLFKLVAKRCKLPYQFIYMRINAEKFARENNQRVDREVNLEDIYAVLASILQCAPAKLEQIKQTEIDVELQYLCAKKSGKLLYERALQENREIVIVTDMYLPKEVIEKCLEKNGYSRYKNLYLSHEHQASKSDGGLYDIVIADAMKRGILPDEILHVGDNWRVDMVMARKKGLDTVIKCKSVECLEQNELARSYFHHTAKDADNCFMMGFWANYIAAIDGERKGTDTRYAYLGAIFAPILIEFTIWMMNDCHNRECDKIVWVYRDGYIFEKIVEILAPYTDYSIDSKQIYLSRAVRYSGYAEKDNGFFQAWIDYSVDKMLLKDFVENRLLISQEQEKKQVLNMIFKATGKGPEDLVGELSDYIEIFVDMEEAFREHARDNLEILREYCLDILGSSHKIAVFDIGYQGKSADFLRMLSGKDIVTYQLLGKDVVGESVDNKSYIRYSNRFFDNLRILHPIFEDLVSSPESSTKQIRKEKGVFLREVEGQTIENGVISRVQEEILKFASGFAKLFREDALKLKFEHFPEFNLVCDFLSRPCRDLAEIITQFKFVDSEFLSKIDSSIYRDWYDEKFNLDK